MRKAVKMRLPYGFFYKRLVDGKYANFLDFHEGVADHVAFSNCVQTEAGQLTKFHNKRQLQFTVNKVEAGVHSIAVELGNYTTFQQLIDDNPAIVAQKNFISQTINDLIDITQQLNEADIFHLCFAPSNVLARKGDGTVRLLCHGSFYAQLDPTVLYKGVEAFVAPEVFVEGSTIDARADVYSLGKFIDWLYQSSGLPFELKSVLAKATAEKPADRYASVKEFSQDMQKRTAARRTGTLAAIAFAVALSALGLFFYLLPSPEVIEYVKPVEDPIPDDMLEDEQMLLGIGADADSATIAKIVAQEKLVKDSFKVDQKKMRKYQAKAERIFRKQFTKAADRILSKVYNKENMSLSEKEFMIRSKAMTEELAKKELELAKKSSLSGDRSQRIASEIVDQLTDKKMKELDKDNKKK